MRQNVVNVMSYMSIRKLLPFRKVGALIDFEMDVNNTPSL